MKNIYGEEVIKTWEVIDHENSSYNKEFDELDDARRYAVIHYFESFIRPAWKDGYFNVGYREPAQELIHTIEDGVVMLLTANFLSDSGIEIVPKETKI